MIPGYVGTRIRSANRRLLITNIIIALLLVMIPVLASHYLKECLNGPFPTTVDDIAKYTSADQVPHNWIAMSFDVNKLDDGVFHLQVTGRNGKDDYYHFLHLGDRVLIIKASSERLLGDIQGSIDFHPDSDVQSDVLPGIAGKVQGQPLPFIVDTGSYRTGMWAMIFICGPLLLLALWNIVKAILRMGDPLKHPTAKQLTPVGPPEEIALAVDAEVREGGAQVGKVLTTRSWLIRPHFFGTDIVYLGDIAWAYKHETVHKSYGVTTNRTYATIVFDVRGKRWQFPLKLPQVEGLLKELLARVPWAFIGYTPELQAAWKKKRADVLAAVEERKRKLTAPDNPTPPPVQDPK